MKKYIISIILIFYTFQMFAQLIESKSEFYISYNTGTFIGNQMYNDQGTIASSFYRNFKAMNGFTLGTTYKFSTHLSGGISIDYLNSTDWETMQSASYNGSSINAFNFCPIIQYHTAFSELGIYNRLKLVESFSPVISTSTVFLPTELAYTTTISHVNEMNYGLRFGIGAEYALSNQLGLFLNSSVQQSFMKSQLYIDSNYTLVNINVGIYFSLMKTKRFNY